MAEKINNRSIILIIALGSLAVAIAYAIPLPSSGPRSLSAIENIHGVPYPSSNSPASQEPPGSRPIIITEELAHADIYLKEPVAFKNIELNIQFDPGSTGALSVGIREDPFWLSYGNRVEIYTAGSQDGEASPSQTRRATVVIPLTDKLQAADGSVDLMFFASGQPVEWQLQQLNATIRPALPTLPQLKDYIRSILKQERPQ